MVLDEHGDYALAHVSRKVDELRGQGDDRAAALWSIVLAGLYHHVEQEREAECINAARAQKAIMLVKPYQ